MRLIEEIGKSATLDQAAEKCIELAHACLKLARYYRNEEVDDKTEEELQDKLIEEMAAIDFFTAELLEDDDFDILYESCQPEKLHKIIDDYARMYKS